MKIYTKTGDKGITALFGGTRVPKHHIRIESYGTVDELNSHLGLIRDQEINSQYQEMLVHIQDKLFTVDDFSKFLSAYKVEQEKIENNRITESLNGKGPKGQISSQASGVSDEEDDEEFDTFGSFRKKHHGF